MDRAMDRIEAALARIERAAAGAPPISDGGWNVHQALKSRVRKALGDLDGLIAELEN